MFNGKDNIGMLTKIAKVLGTDELYYFTDHYNVTLDVRYHKKFKTPFPKLEWNTFVTPEN